jgi:DNA-binding LacI/PurR family transcriptional regulator
MSVVRIAQRAGVSIATVSRVMNSSRKVQPQIEQKVRAAMQELGLSAKRVRARSVTRRLHDSLKTIAIIALGTEYHAWFKDPVIASVIAEVSRTAQDSQLGVLLAQMPDAKKICKVVEDGQVDGALVLMPVGCDQTLATTLSRRIPVVRIMGADLGPTIIDHVAPDNMGVGYLAADYLISRGCRQLAFMSMNPDWPISKLRAAGFCQAVDARPEAGASAQPYFTAQANPVAHSYISSTICLPTWEAVMDEFCKRRPDGLFVSRDAELVHVSRMLKERGIQAGHDLEVVSCDNADALLSTLDNRPTSIDLCVNDIATSAVQLLMSRIKQPSDHAVRILVNPKLAVLARE